MNAAKGKAEKGASAPTCATSREAFDAWRKAAKKWRKLRSDATEAECRAARTAYYTLAWGDVPPLAHTCASCEEVL